MHLVFTFVFRMRSGLSFAKLVNPQLINIDSTSFVTTADGLARYACSLQAMKTRESTRATVLATVIFACTTVPELTARTKAMQKQQAHWRRRVERGAMEQQHSLKESVQENDVSYFSCISSLWLAIGM